MPFAFQISVAAEAAPATCTVQLVDPSTARAELRWIPELRKHADQLVKGMVAPGTANLEVREEGKFRYYRVFQRIKSDWVQVE